MLFKPFSSLQDKKETAKTGKELTHEKRKKKEQEEEKEKVCLQVVRSTVDVVEEMKTTAKRQRGREME